MCSVITSWVSSCYPSVTELFQYNDYHKTLSTLVHEFILHSKRTKCGKNDEKVLDDFVLA